MIDRFLTYGRMIKFSHSIFALPFALSGVVLASSHSEITLETVLWVIVAMVGARSAAMGFNRWADRKMDAENPRTANRELPTGQISSVAVLTFIAISSAVLVYSAYRLNPLCFALSPVTLGIVFFYSLTKRFTWATQLFLGLALSIAPIGAWIAVTGRLDLEILVLGGAVLLWVAGFDIIYATVDIEFDRQYGAYSIPQRFGIPKALWVSRAQPFVGQEKQKPGGVRKEGRSPPACVHLGAPRFLRKEGEISPTLRTSPGFCFSCPAKGCGREPRARRN